MSGSFRNSAAFGKRIEYWIIGLLLKDGFDVFVPIVDDDGIDAIIRSSNGRKIDLQIKARSATVGFGDAALFAALNHPDEREGYFFLFHSERMKMSWLMSSKDFIQQAHTNKSGKNVGKRSIWFNGKNTRKNAEHPKSKFERWRIAENDTHDFSRISKYLDNGFEVLGA